MHPLGDDRSQTDGTANGVPATLNGECDLRPARESDLDAVARLDAVVFPEDPYPYFVLRQLTELPGLGLSVIADGESLRGYVLYAAAPGADVGWLLSLGVDPAHRGRGYGRWLVAEALRRTVAEGVTETRATVRPDNTASLAICHSLGFVEVAYLPDYFGPGDDRLLLVRRD